MANQNAISRGDKFLESKHADEAIKFSDDGGFMLVFYNEPRKRKAIIVDYTPEDYPQVTVSIKANWKALKFVEKIRKEEKIKEGPF